MFQRLPGRRGLTGGLGILLVFASTTAFADGVCDPPDDTYPPSASVDYAECADGLSPVSLWALCGAEPNPSACAEQIVTACAASLYQARCNFLPQLAVAGADASVQELVLWVLGHANFKGFLLTWAMNYLSNMYPWHGPTRALDPATLAYFRAWPERWRVWNGDMAAIVAATLNARETAKEQLRKDAIEESQKIAMQMAAASQSMEQIIAAFSFLNSGADLGVYVTEVYPDSYVPVPVGDTAACMNLGCTGRREEHVRHSIPNTDVFIDDVSTCYYGPNGLILCAPGTSPAPVAPAAATLFDGAAFTGDSFTAASSVPWVGDEWNDRISSILVPAGRVVTLFDDINYGGASVVLVSPGVVDLGETSWGDRTSSILIQ